MIREILFKNIANLVVFFRILLVFLIIALFSQDLFSCRVAALIVLIITALLDGIDGYIARKLQISSKIGSLLDTLGDRITENLLLIFFAYKQLIPLAIPLIFVARSFMADFVRAQNFQRGISTFEINTSGLGQVFVSSKISRVTYLIGKIIVFFLGGIILTLEAYPFKTDPVLIPGLRIAIYWGAVFILTFNVLRFILLVYDSRESLRETFTK